MSLIPIVPPGSAIVPVFTHTLTINSTTWTSFTLVQVIPAGLLDGAASKIRITMSGATTSPTGIAQAHIGHRASSGDSYDFAASPVPLMVGGNTAFEIPQSGTLVSDDIDFQYDGVSDLIVAFSITSDTAKDDIRISTAGNGGSYYFKSAGSDSGTVNKSGYGAAGANPNALGIISQIEMDV